MPLQGDMAVRVTSDFTRSLPKVELHAHLSGSISITCLHKIWSKKRCNGQCLDLEDPLTTIQPRSESVNIVTFFALFDKYIYSLVADIPSVKFATQRVLQDFEQDGVVYLELRTTPRANLTTGMTEEGYVDAVSEVLEGYEGDLEVYLILSIDRKMSPAQAEGVVDLALRNNRESGRIVGIDLCGSPFVPLREDLTPAFQRARAYGLKITVHFAETPQSGTDRELETLLSWRPDRLGHVINVPVAFKRIIEERKLGLELCLSCNVLAKLTTGGFARHHFDEWRKTKCPIALSTDDVGVFGSPLSNEYLLATTHFGLSWQDLINLSLSAASSTFSENTKLVHRIQQFRHKLTALEDMVT